MKYMKWYVKEKTTTISGGNFGLIIVNNIIYKAFRMYCKKMNCGNIYLNLAKIV